MAVYPKAPGNSIIKKVIRAKKRVLAPNKITDLASPSSDRAQTPVSNRNSNGPKGGSSKSSVPANRTWKITPATIKPKVPKVTKSKLNTTPKTKFNRSSRVNYRQLRRSK